MLDWGSVLCNSDHPHFIVYGEIWLGSLVGRAAHILALEERCPRCGGRHAIAVQISQQPSVQIWHGMDSDPGSFILFQRCCPCPGQFLQVVHFSHFESPMSRFHRFLKFVQNNHDTSPNNNRHNTSAESLPRANGPSWCEWVLVREQILVATRFAPTSSALSRSPLALEPGSCFFAYALLPVCPTTSK